MWYDLTKGKKKTNTNYMVGSQDDFNAMDWRAKLIYAQQSPDSDFVKNEYNRATQVLGESGGKNEGAKNWISQLSAARSGVNMDNVISGNFDKERFSAPGSGDMVNVRGELEKMGVNSGRVGWESDGEGFGRVTLDGKEFAVPDAVVDGVSKMDREDFQSAVVKALSGDVTPASDYMAASGLPYAISQNPDGSVNLFGQSATPLFTLGGKAYFRKSDLDRMAQAYQEQNGVQTGAQMLQDYNSRYGNRINNRQRDLENYEDFNYNYEADPIYRAMAEVYQKRADRAMRDAQTRAASLTDGYANTAAVSAAMQGAGQWAQALADTLPTLARDAYSRYADQRAFDQQNLRNLMEQGDSWYNKAYQTNRDTIGDINYANELQTQRYDKQYERDYQSGRDTVADEQWRQEFDEGRREFDIGASLDASTLSGYWTDEAARYLGTEPGGELYATTADKADRALQQRIADDERMLNLWSTNGYATPEVAAYFGVPEGTPTDSHYFNERSANLADNQLALQERIHNDDMAYKYTALNKSSSRSSSGGSSKSSSGGNELSKNYKTNRNSLINAANDFMEENYEGMKLFERDISGNYHVASGQMDNAIMAVIDSEEMSAYDKLYFLESELGIPAEKIESVVNEARDKASAGLN